MAPRKPVPPVDLEGLRTTLRTGSVAQRRKAAEQLGKARDPGALDALVGALEDADEGLRGRAAAALAALGGEAALAALLQRAPRETRPKAFLALIGALGRFPSPRSAAMLGALLRRHGAPERHNAVQWQHGWALADALGAMGAHGVAEALSCLAAGSPVTEHAVRALGLAGDVAVVDTLVDTYRQTRVHSVREAVVMALGALVCPASTALLVEVLVQDGVVGGSLGHKAALSLVRHGHAAAEALAPWLRAPGPEAASAAYVFALGEGALDDTVRVAMVALLQRRDTMVWAQTSLARDPAGLDAACGAADTLGDQLASDDDDRAYAAAWIARHRPDALSDTCLGRLVAAMGLSPHDTRARVADALSALIPRGAAAVAAGLRHHDLRVRHTAVMALAQSSAPPLAAAYDLAALLDDEACAVWASEALRRIGPSARDALGPMAAGQGEGARRAQLLRAVWG
jgi:hypothetical protein